MTAAHDFMAAIAATGLTPPGELIADGTLHRFSSNGRAKDDAGWYVFHDDDRPAGRFGCNRAGIDSPWRADIKKEFTAEEKAAWKRRMDEQRAARDAETARQRANAASQALDMWKRATPANGHAYLARKGIAGDAAAASSRELDGILLVPVKHGPRELVGLQRIDAEGGKKFLHGTPAGGGYTTIGRPAPGAPVVIVEGYATGLTVHQATGFCVVVAFNAGNLDPVAKKIRAAMPDAALVIGADDDAFTEGNPGMSAAAAAGRAVGARVVKPTWVDSDRGRGTDFNDLANTEGLQAVADCFGEPEPRPDIDQETGEILPPEPVAPKEAPMSSEVAPATPVVDVSREGLVLAFGLDATSSGLAHPTVANVVRVLMQDPSLHRVVWYDEFLQRICTIWGGTKVREWSDIDDINLQIYLQERLGLPKLNKKTVADAIESVAQRDRRNEAKAYIDGLTWDGTPRLSAFFVDCFGADDTAYTQAVGRNFWLSLVARVIRPGCKVDTMIVLEGIQGAGKSKALAIIGGQWFSEAHESPTSKDFYLNLSGKMLVEIGEMDAFNRSEVTKVKQVITCQTDRYRAPFERRSADHPRRCVFAGTTNRDDWNKDETGARRFWPIYCHDIDHAGIAANRDQLFAEASAALAAGADWWTMPMEATIGQQEARRDADELEPVIADWLVGRAVISVGEIMSDLIKVPLERQDKALQMRIGRVLRVLTWRRPHHPVYRNGKQVRLWFRRVEEAVQYADRGAGEVVENYPL